MSIRFQLVTLSLLNQLYLNHLKIYFIFERLLLSLNITLLCDVTLPPFSTAAAIRTGAVRKTHATSMLGQGLQGNQFNKTKANDLGREQDYFSNI